MGVFLFPFFVTGQQEGADGQEAAGLQGSVGRVAPAVAGQRGTGTGTPQLYTDPAGTFVSNVPINELNAKAFRRFHRRFQAAAGGEAWFKSAEGYQVSFMLDRHHQLAYYDPHGGFMYSLKYYETNEIPREVGDFVKRRYPGYRIDVVTEVCDGMKTFYLVQIMNADYIKSLSISDGRIEELQELHNGSATIDVAQAAR